MKPGTGPAGIATTTRPLAPHVQAACAASLQRCQPAGARPAIALPAPQAKPATAVQPRLSGAPPAPAAHVQAAIAACVQPRQAACTPVAVLRGNARPGEAKAPAARAAVPPMRPAPVPAARRAAVPVQRARPIQRLALRWPGGAVIQRTITVGSTVLDATTFTQQYKTNGGEVGEHEGIFDEVVAFFDHEDTTFNNWTRAKKEVTGVLNLAADPFSWIAPLMELARTITEEYPPSEYHYVGLGRSPAAIVEALMRLGHTAVTVPLGGMKLKSGTLTNPVLPDLTTTELGRVRSLIRLHIGTPGMKKILLMDYTQSGEGLRVGQRLIESAVNNEVVPLALEAGGFVNPRAEDFRTAGMRRMTLPGALDNETSVSSLIGGSALKPFSPFHALSLARAKQGDPAVANPLGQRMADAFGLYRMAQDGLRGEQAALNNAVRGIGTTAAGLLPFQALTLALFELDYEKSLLAGATTLAGLRSVKGQIEESRLSYCRDRLKPVEDQLRDAADQEGNSTKQGLLVAFANALGALVRPLWVGRFMAALYMYGA